jgi:hypothetical protein
MKLETRRGSCHCGAVVFEVDLESELTNARRCNCSLCRRKGTIMIVIPLERLRVIKGQDKLTLYQWNAQVAKHYFCSVCGIYTHHQRRRDPSTYGVNVGCLDGVDPFGLGEIPVSDGAAHSVVENPAKSPTVD